MSSSGLTAPLLVASADPSIGSVGVTIGYEVTSRLWFAYNAFSLYGSALRGTDALVFGMIGYGKSVGEKVFIARQLRMGRRVVVLSSKQQTEIGAASTPSCAARWAAR